jgi:hypothetical protein
MVGLADIDLYGYLGDNGAHTPYTNPLYFDGPLNYNGTGLGKYLNNQAISAWSTVGHSNYNALQASLRRQFSNGRPLHRTGASPVRHLFEPANAAASHAVRAAL